AVTGLRNLGKEDEAERFDDMTATDYAEHKGIELRENPSRRTTIMAKKTAPSFAPNSTRQTTTLHSLDPNLTTLPAS
ncbi:MAG: hypothetical protein ABJF23_30785, partial [Bryobacteraceae bacterium]